MTRKELCEAHYGMVEVVVDAMRIREEDRDELLSIGYEVLVRASKEYEPDRNILFRTYASQSIRQAILNHLRKIRKEKKRVIPIENINEKFLHDQMEDLKGEGIETYDWTLVDACAPEKDPDRTLYYECIIGDQTIREVSESLGLTRKAGKERLSRLRKKIKETLNEN